MFKASVFLAAVCMLASASALCAEADGQIVSGKEINVDGKFVKGGDGEKPSHDLSGIACRRENDSRRRCVVIDDQGLFAQTAILEDHELKPKDPVELIFKTKEVYGVAPKAGCPDVGFKDLDGEGVAYDGDYFYVVGSHGCSRKNNEFSRSAFITTRFRLDASGKAVEPAEATYRLSDALKKADNVRNFFGKNLKDENGLNIEGVAVVNGMLYAGARAPSLGGKAFIVAAKVSDLFAPGPLEGSFDVREITLDLGEGVGIRDLALLLDGRLLVLAGPAQDQDTLFSLYAVTLPEASGPAKKKSIASLEDLPFAKDGDGDMKRPKAEAVLPLDESGGKLRALVLFDVPKNGSPREYRATLPPP
ncbi:conserved hypothetical protein [Methylocella silvestris BL2]|uniref:DUF3616 domain-containing protein n=1 Tax=Methylocella silvestris (strain DSM 15510 / CIP 108128 / LMG 27833 / NCIMB 13906 / BL2) TaxID=395965 RepID=B8ERA2_METSB|nr:DUF3616 domain-containing protein [Methylocella silvestris]ACK50286.1 conserved hypothetical protein [Methylocella silvestris BL2]